MALPVIQANSFTGSKMLSLSNGNNEDVESLAVETIDLWVRKILSDAAYLDIVATSKSKWNHLFNGSDWTDSNGFVRIHKGFTDVLRGITYFEYTRNPIYHNSVGFTVHNGQNSKAAEASQIYQKATNVYNASIRSLRCEIYDFLNFYSSITGVITGFTDNGLGSYTILTSSTKYLDNADSVTINGIDYIVSNLAEDTSFDIAADLGLSFNGSFIYKPFDELNLPNLEIIV